MIKFEEIEKLLNQWKADSKKAYEDGDYEYEKLSVDRAIALESALVILGDPSSFENTMGKLEQCKWFCEHRGKPYCKYRDCLVKTVYR